MSSKRILPVRRVRNAAYYDDLISQGERAFAGINARAWEAFERSEQETAPPPEPSPRKSH